jgi:hypothetical protein
VVSIPLLVAGTCEVALESERGLTTVLEVLPHNVDWNGAYYEPRLFAETDYVMTSSAVRGRFEEDPGRFARQAAFYRWLDTSCRPVARFAPRPGLPGPELRLYQITDAARAAPACAGALDTLWWAATVPERYRRQAQTLIGVAGEGTSVRRRDGSTAPWVRSVGALYRDRVRTFALELAFEAASLERFTAAQHLAASALAVDPADVEACLVYSVCARGRQQWAEARAAVERTSSARGGASDPALQLEHARALVHLGERAAAMAEIEALLATVGAESPFGREAAALKITIERS